MPKYHCDYCSKSILNATPRRIQIHNQGSHHGIMKKAYYIEMLEQSSLQEEHESYKRRLGNMSFNSILFSPDMVSNRTFKRPPIKLCASFTIPKAPNGFRLPKSFNFSDPSIFVGSLEQALYRLHKKFPNTD